MVPLAARVQQNFRSLKIHFFPLTTSAPLVSIHFVESCVSIPDDRAAPQMPTPDSPTNFDVLVVGSGASGGWAAKRLSEAGLNVVIVEAGRPQSDENFTDDEPYPPPADKPFNWMGRLRMTGGRTNVWGRVSLRFSDWDFKSASHDGYGEDWPISYSDVAPYYDIVEKYVGITGMAEGLEHLPDGQFQPPMPLTCQETVFREKVKAKFGRTVTLARSANITRPINGRGPCHFCGPCERGCVTHSYFNSAFTTVADAVATGNCTLISNAMVYKVLMDHEGRRARGVLYIDRNSRTEHEVLARCVVLCAQSQESVRILFNSATPQHPNGLANSSGVLGHYFTA